MKIIHLETMKNVFVQWCSHRSSGTLCDNHRVYPSACGCSKGEMKCTDKIRDEGSNMIETHNAGEILVAEL